MPEDLREFVTEQVRSGRYPNTAEVLRDAVAALRDRQQRLDSLRAALDTGIDQLDAGDFIEGTPAEQSQAPRSDRPFER